LNLIEGSRGSICPTSLASRNEVDAFGAFLEANGMTVVDPPGEYYGRSRPRRHEARSHGVQAAAEATAGGKEEIAEAYREGRLTGPSDLSPIHGKA
jgi:hypothetical protein